MMYAGGVFRLAARVLKSQDHCHKRLFRWLPSPGLGIDKDEPLVLGDFEVDAPIRIFVTVGVTGESYKSEANKMPRDGPFWRHRYCNRDKIVRLTSMMQHC
jgi:hypothetical protein